VDEATTRRRLVAALLLNALVMPGSGHISLGLRAKGLAISALTIAALLFAIMRFTASAMQAIRTSPQAGGMAAQAMSSLSAAYGANETVLLSCLLAIVALWAFGILDILRMMRSGGRG
jgi:hypothetical protein